MESGDVHEYQRVDAVAKEYFRFIMSHSPTRNVFRFLRSPEGRARRGAFQAFAFMRGMQFVTKRTWYMRLLKNDPPDVEAVSPEPAPGIRVEVENVSVTKQRVARAGRWGWSAVE